MGDAQGAFSIENPGVERIEVLRGPASVLYGFGNPGGTINVVTRQPLQDAFYSAEATVGNYDFYRGAIDLTGPLNDSGTILYRLNAAYRNSGSFIDFVDSEFFGIAPIVSFAIGERTRLTLEGEYSDRTDGYYPGLPIAVDVPRSRNLAGPSIDTEVTFRQIGYNLEHEFSDNWSLRNAFRVRSRHYRDNLIFPTNVRSDNRTYDRESRDYDLRNDEYIITTDLIGRFSTGSIEHQVLFGVDLNRISNASLGILRTASPIDLFDPEYDQSRGSILDLSFDNNLIRDSLGIFVQDQVTLADSLKLLLGGRLSGAEKS
jgi:iron complex outermembrane recepter protein